MRIPSLLLAALLALVPSLALAQGAPAPIRIPRGSTGPADGFTVAGRPLSSIVESEDSLTKLKSNRSVISGNPARPVSSVVSRSGDCDVTAGHFIQNWNTNNYVPDCSGIFQGEEIPVGSVRGARSKLNPDGSIFLGPDGKPVIDLNDPEVGRLVVQQIDKGTHHGGVIFVNQRITRGAGKGVGGEDIASTGLGIHQFIGADEDGINFAGKIWAGNIDQWWGPNSGRHQGIGIEHDINYYNKDCGYDAPTLTGCFLVRQWSSYYSEQAFGTDTLIRSITGPAIFGHLTVSGTTVTATDWEATIGGLDGPFSKGMTYLWLYTGNGVQAGPGTFYRVRSVTSTKTAILEKAPGNGTFGFQFNPPQLRTGIQIDTGGDITDTTNNQRTLHANLVAENEVALLSYAYRGLMIGGRQAIGVDTSLALDMTYTYLAAPGQNFCLSGLTGCFQGDASGRVYAPRLASSGTFSGPMFDTSQATVSGASVINLAAGQPLCLANNATCIRGDTNAGSPYALMPPMAWTGGQPAPLLDSTTATINGNLFAALGSTHIIRGGLLAPQQLTKAQLPTCGAPLLGARVTIIDISGTPTWGQAVSALNGGGIGVAAYPVFCDGGVAGTGTTKGWVIM